MNPALHSQTYLPKVLRKFRSNRLPAPTTATRQDTLQSILCWSPFYIYSTEWRALYKNQ